MAGQFHLAKHLYKESSTNKHILFIPVWKVKMFSLRAVERAQHSLTMTIQNRSVKKEVQYYV